MTLDSILNQFMLKLLSHFKTLKKKIIEILNLSKERLQIYSGLS
jgi:hypothetical protein